MTLSSTVEKKPLPPSIRTPPLTWAKCTCSEAGSVARIPPRIVPVSVRPPSPGSAPRTKVAPSPTLTPPRTSMFAFVPSHVAPAGTTSLWYLPEASVPVHVDVPCGPLAVASPAVSAVVASAPMITNPTLRIATPFALRFGRKDLIPSAYAHWGLRQGRVDAARASILLARPNSGRRAQSSSRPGRGHHGCRRRKHVSSTFSPR